jgi:hypothetical protein
MKAVIITLALATLASAASVDAQIVGSRLPTPSTSRGTTVNGSWSVVGRDGSGYTMSAVSVTATATSSYSVHAATQTAT